MHSPASYLSNFSIDAAIDFNPIILSPRTRLIEAMQQLALAKNSCKLPNFNPFSEIIEPSQVKASCVLIVEAGRLMGLLTERDFVRFAAQGMPLVDITVETVMTKQLITLPKSEWRDIFTILNLFRQHTIRHLPVVNDTGELLGVITPDTIRACLQPADLLKWQRVADVMTTHLIHAPINTSLLAIAQQMAEAKVSCVIITEQSSEHLFPLGIITERDILQFQSLGLNFQTLLAKNVMSAPVFSVKPTDSVWTAHQQMQKQQVRRLVVCETSGKLVGIITQTSLFRALDPLEMYSVIQALQQQVSQQTTAIASLEAEKLELLQNRTLELEKQIEERTLEKTRLIASLQEQVQSDRLLASIALRMLESLNLEEILKTTVTQIRQLFQADRVLIYRFNPQWSGVVVVESVNSPWISLQGQEISDPCFTKTWAEMYQYGRIQATADIYTSGLAECHVEFLSQLQIQANLVVPVILLERHYQDAESEETVQKKSKLNARSSQLWGLLIVHQCSQTRQWQQWEIELMQKLATQVAIAIQQCTFSEQAQREIQRSTQAEVALKNAKDKLETRILERTAELEKMNQQLQQEIAERQHAEEALQDAKDQFQAVLDAVPGCISWISPEEKNLSNLYYVGANRHLAALFDLTPEAFIGQSVGFLGSSLEFPEYARQFFASSATEASVEINVEVENATRTYLVVSQKYHQNLAAVFVGIDITAHKQAEEALLKSAATNRALLNAVPDVIFRLKRDGTFVNYKGAKDHDTFLQRKDLIGKKVTHIFPLDVAQPLLQAIAEALATGNIQILEYQLPKSGSLCEWEARIATSGADEVLVIARDITERKHVEEKLQQANDQLAAWVNELEQRNREMELLGEMNEFLQACLTVEEAYSAIATFVEPLFPHCSGALFTVNSANNLIDAVATWGTHLCTQMLFSRNECWGLRRGQLFYADRIQFGLLCQHLHPDSSLAESLCVPMMAQGEIMGLLYFNSSEVGRLNGAKQNLARTVSEQIALALANLKLRQTLHNQSIRDPLTGLFNRRYLEESLEREIYRAQRSSKPVGIIMIDVDHFKRFNDTWGHEAGDTVLRELGQCLEKSIRGSDIACRYGGEELILILPDASMEITQKRAEEIRQKVKRLKIHYQRQSLGSISISIGVACFPEHGTTAEAAIQAADAALYRAKKEGRDRVISAECAG